MKARSDAMQPCLLCLIMLNTLHNSGQSLSFFFQRFFCCIGNIINGKNERVEGAGNLIPCPECGRKFAEGRLETHRRICNKVIRIFCQTYNSCDREF